MDYQAMYQQKLTTAEEAVKVVRSGDWVDYTWCTNHPIALDKALAARRDELTDVKVRGGVTMWMPEIARRRTPATTSPGTPALQRHRPQDHHQGHGLLQSHALLRAAPLLPGESGPCGRGDAPDHPHGCPWQLQLRPAASHLADLMSRAKCIIVEVNENMPWVYGLTGTEINIQDVTYVVEGDNPPVAQLGAGGEPTDVDRAVANLVVPQIPNGACLQLGIGGHAQHHRRHDRPVRPEGPVCPHGDVCGWLRGHGGRRQDHRPAQGP